MIKRLKKMFVYLGMFLTGMLSNVSAIEDKYGVFDPTEIPTKYGVYNPVTPKTTNMFFGTTLKIAIPVILFIIGILVLLNKKVNKTLKIIVAVILAILLYIILGNLIFDIFSNIFMVINNNL